MKAITRHQATDQTVTFYDEDGAPLVVQASDLALTHMGRRLTECRLTFRAGLEVYRRIYQDKLLSLCPEVGSAADVECFAPDSDLQIEADLKPEMFAFVSHCENPTQASDYLANICREDPLSPVLFTENWLALRVQQGRGRKKLGFQTRWAQAADALREADSVQEISVDRSGPGECQEDEAAIEPGVGETPLYEAMKRFFEADEWPYTPEPDQPVLRLRFRGSAGEWNCYAQAREPYGQFVFYSFAPVEVPSPRRLAASEFLHRANLGLAVGNFEYDFDGGRIRFKTSVDVGKGTLDHSLIRQVVYANVTMMDRYLPGLLSVLAGLEPARAIQDVEGRSA